MAQRSSKPSAGSGNVTATEAGLGSEIMGMASAFWVSRERNRLLILTAAVIAVVWATAYAQIRLNAWNQPFYNALTRKDMSAFVEQLGVFAVIAGILLVLNVAQTWLNQTSKVVLREGLVHDLLKEWLMPVRAFRLSNSGDMGANPDQRLHADAQHLTDLTTDLGIGLLQSTLLLMSFVGVLWVLSRNMILSLSGHTFSVPGYMVWCALFYAGTASFLSWRIGRPLVTLDTEHYALEAELRFSLVRANEEIEGVTIYGGEAQERDHINALFEAAVAVSRRIVSAVTRLTWITAGYGWFTIVAPILVAAPSYFLGEMSFGELMMVIGAFNQVQQSLRWFVDNFSSIADWRATLLRVASFRKTILTMDQLGLTASRITVKVTEEQSIRMDDLRVAAPEGCVKLSEAHLQANPGERILIVGEHGSEKTLLFRAIVGLWPWGSGRITHPSRQSMMFMPARAYIPPGTLRSAVSYPHPISLYSDAVVTKAFADVGLERLQPVLDRIDRWDRRLTDDEKQCLAFARVVLQKPRWVVLDGAFDVLDPASRGRIEATFTGELADVGIINVGHDEIQNTFFTRTLHLMIDPRGPTFTLSEPRGTLVQSEPAPEASSAQ
jgi:vitamin B12/bleomycin/antimicrobial peptide transport system ATP-binding/permease protein